MRRIPALILMVVAMAIIAGTGASAQEVPQPTLPEPAIEELENGGFGQFIANNPMLVGEDVTVAAGETVDNVFVVRGSARIDGTVTGAVVGLKSPITVGSGATIGASSIDVGNGVAIASWDGPVTIEAGATVNGDIYSNAEISVADAANVSGDQIVLTREGAVTLVGDMFFSTFDGIGTAMWIAMIVMVSVSTLALGYLLILFGRSGLNNAVAAGKRSIGKSIGWGLFVAIVVPIAALLVMATVVAAPLGWGVWSSLGLLAAVGYTVGIYFVGRLILGDRFGHALTFLIAWAIYTVIAFLSLIPVIVGVVVVVWIVTSIYGVGMVAVAAWRVRKPSTPASSAPESGGDSPESITVPSVIDSAAST